MEAQLQKVKLEGRRTKPSEVRKVTQIISNETYRIAKECSVIVGYPKRRIVGNRVELGEESIILPNLRIVSMAQLRQIEQG